MLIAVVQQCLGLVNELFCAMLAELFDVRDGRRAHGRHVSRLGPIGIRSSMAVPSHIMVGIHFIYIDWYCDLRRYLGAPWPCSNHMGL